MRIFTGLLLLIITINESMQKSTPESSSYTAVTVEYKPVIYRDDPKRTLNKNAEEFKGIIDQVAVEQDADIIVFPEFGLTSLHLPSASDLFNWSTLVPDGERNFRPCTDTSNTVSEALKTIACSAARNTVFVVANVIEREKCGSEIGCPSYKYYYYSTNVVFNQDGTIIKRYRRFYQSDDLPLLNHPKVPDISTFDTTFGVTFGNIIGMDIMYEEPLTTLLEERGVTDLVYTAAWHNVLPFETAIQIQSGWAWVKNVNLLAAGLNDWDRGYSGSGIYPGKQKNPDSTLATHRKTLHAIVTKKTKRANGRYTSNDYDKYKHDELRRSINYQDVKLGYENLDGFIFGGITETGSTIANLTDDRLTCEFHVDVSNLSPSENYYFVAHDTGAPVGNDTVRGTRICAIIQCADTFSLKSCSIPRSSETEFTFISITASYVDNGRTLMMPSTLLAKPDLDLFDVDAFTFKESVKGEKTLKTISLTGATNNLVTFGIWGRNFGTDVPDMAQSNIFDAIRWLLLAIFIVVIFMAVMFICYRYRKHIISTKLYQRLMERCSKTGTEDALRGLEIDPKPHLDSTAVPLRRERESS